MVRTVTVACFVLMVANARSADSDVAATIEAIQRASKARRLQFRNVWLKYRVHEFQSKEFLRDLGQARPADAPPRRGPAYSDLRFTVTTEYVRKGDLARMVFEGPSVEDGQSRPSVGPAVHVFNGRRTILSNGSGKYAMTVKPEAVNGFATIWDLSGEDLLQRTFDYDRTKQINLTERKVSPGPTPDVLQLGLVSDNKWRSKVLLLPQLGYSVRQFDVFNGTGSLITRYHSIEYDSVDGVPYPIRATLSRYKASGNKSELYAESRLEVASVTTNRGDIPDSLFELALQRVFVGVE